MWLSRILLPRVICYPLCEKCPQESALQIKERNGFAVYPDDRSLRVHRSNVVWPKHKASQLDTYQAVILVMEELFGSAIFILARLHKPGSDLDIMVREIWDRNKS